MQNTFFIYLASLVAQADNPPPPTTTQVETGFVYVIAAFTVVWLFIAGYLFWLNRRQDNLRREVELLRQEEAERRQRETQSDPAQSTIPASSREALEEPVSPVQGRKGQNLGG